MALETSPTAAAGVLSSPTLLSARTADVGRARESRRRHRLKVAAAVLGLPTAFLWFRLLSGDPFNVFALPHVDPLLLFAMLIPVTIIAAVVVPQVAMGRSPHITYTPEQIGVRLDDVVGVEQVKEEVVRSLNLFLAHKTFADEMGGRPRRGLLFEGPPGTGKTLLAKAMAAEAGVPFLFVSATAFQSMFYGATARKIRSYFKVLRKTAEREGGAIGFIEEIDAIAGARGGMERAGFSSFTRIPVAPMSSDFCCSGPQVSAAAPATPAGIAVNPNGQISEGTGGVVNELLVQMQSFDTPSGMQKFAGSLIAMLNAFLPPQRQIAQPEPKKANILLVAATNRADSLDPALLRPGRFDRRLTFGLPGKSSRRALVDYYLDRKAHVAELDDPERRDALAAVTQGYSPAKLEHLLDEGLVNAVRRGTKAMSWNDVEHARLTTEVGLGMPVEYTAGERVLIATHEAGHATVAHLVAPQRRLEVLTIIKRGEALGLLAHGDRDDVYTRSRAELTSMIQISLGGQVAEELFFGDVSTGPAGDLAYATQVGAEMIGSAGMANSLVSFAASQEGFGGANLVGKVLGDSNARGQLEELLHAQQAFVRELLGRNRHLVEALRDGLLEREELIGSEITDLLDAAAAAAAERAVNAAPTVLDLRESEDVRS
ncbi:MAG: cell division protease FtsH [Frankiaceae bacterium]|nr:cell division protease FtsH [Frankiaceae bacterium]